MYHPHADEMVQMAMGMMGSFVVHPRHPRFMRVDRDFVLLLNAYDIDPGGYVPKVMTMLDFNLWTINSRAFPGIDHLVVRKGDRVRVRIGNLTMTNHPIHLHGYHFEVTGTDGGWIPQNARWPEVTTDIPVGAMRAYEFLADEPGDWALRLQYIQKYKAILSQYEAETDVLVVDQTHNPGGSYCSEFYTIFATG